MKIKEQDGQYMVISGIFDKVLIDKTIKTITVRNMRSLFRKREIPFSSVRSIDIGHREVPKGDGMGDIGGYAAGTEDMYSVIVRIEGWNIVVERSTSYENIRQLAETIGDFVGKPLPKRTEELTRDELVARWKSRGK